MGYNIGPSVSFAMSFCRFQTFRKSKCTRDDKTSTIQISAERGYFIDYLII